MRTLLLASAAVLALGGTAMAQTFSGNSPNNPRSTMASNITAADTHSRIAPALPTAGYDLTYEQFLQTARQAVNAGKTGLAQQSLEQAETRLLTRSVPIGQGNVADNGPRIDALRNARVALSRGDRSAVLQNIQLAEETHGMNGGAMQSPGMGNTQAMTGGAMPGNSAPPMVVQAQPQNNYAPPTGNSAAENQRIYGSCSTPPCQLGTPPAAPGGTVGQAPTALQQSPVNSPVGNGAGGGTAGSKTSPNSGGPMQ